MIDHLEIETDLEINKGLSSPLFIKYVGGEEKIRTSDPGFPRCSLSRGVPSTTRPLLRITSLN